MTLLAAAVGTTIAGTAMQAYGQYREGKSQEAMHEYNAQVQANQAKQEEWAAAYDADMLRERGRKFRATQRTKYAASGVTMEGSPLLVLEDTARQIGRDVVMTRYGGQRRAGYYRSQSGLSLFKGREAMQAGRIGAGKSLLSGASTAFQRYYQMKK